MTRTDFLKLEKREPSDKYSREGNNSNLDKIDLFAQTISMGIIGIPVEETGQVISLTDASNNELKNLVVYGKTTQDGTPTPEAPVDLASVENPTVTITDGAEQSQSLSVPYTLNEGDFVDFEKGVLVRKYENLVLNGTENWLETITQASNIKRHYIEPVHNAVVTGNSFKVKGLCSHYKITSANEGYLGNEGISFSILNASGNTNLYIYDTRFNTSGSTSQLKSWLAQNPVTLVYELATPIETSLTEAELNAYKSLHTYKPNTVISNSEDAEMKVEYLADTKIYIDNKFAELNNAILNNI